MENNKTNKKVWVDGNTLVKIDGEKMVEYELNGNGYPAKLKAFITRREEALKEQEKINAKYCKKSTKPEEPGLE